MTGLLLIFDQRFVLHSVEPTCPTSGQLGTNATVIFLDSESGRRLVKKEAWLYSTYDVQSLKKRRIEEVNHLSIYY
jgi:hypothetical protein